MIIVVKTFLLLLIVSFLSFAQNPINLTGSVKDSRTDAPIADANVTLLGSNIPTVTGSDGTFSITGTSLLQTRPFTSNGKFPLSGTNVLFFRQEKEDLITIRILDLSGRQVVPVFSGTLNNGFWMVQPPELSPGVYLCTFETPRTHRSVRFLTSGSGSASPSGALLRPVNISDSNCDALSKRKSAPLPVDSLLVEKEGYRSVTTPLDSYEQTNLEILLEDTSKADLADATIIPDPSWTCFMPEGIPPPQLGEKVFTIVLNYSAVHDVGVTRFGYRYQYDIQGGSIKGNGIDGTALSGGLDYELTLSNGSMELEQIVIFKAGNTHILMRNAGVAPSGAEHVRVVLDFEAPNSSSYAWLHDSKYAADRIIDSTTKTITLEVYDISDVSLTENRVEINDPEDAENQTWECVKVNGSQGAQVFTENVTLGGSISIGATKRGSRNIIPITGGTTTGRVEGKILSGGADYQLGGLDARYTLEPDEGEFIIIRNCGSGQLIPVFEARVDGPYNFLNENKYLSSQPGIGGGGVSITFYEIN